MQANNLGDAPFDMLENGLDGLDWEVPGLSDDPAITDGPPSHNVAPEPPM